MSVGENDLEQPQDDAPRAKGPPREKTPRGLPAAGPHADPSLTNEDATPGTGSLPEAGDRESDATSG